MIDLIVTALATWRLTSLLVSEHGPAGVFQLLRDWADEHAPMLADILACVWCCSVWVGFFFALPQAPRWLKYALAYSAVAIMIHKLVEAFDEELPE